MAFLKIFGLQYHCALLHFVELKMASIDPVYQAGEGSVLPLGNDVREVTFLSVFVLI